MASTIKNSVELDAQGKASPSSRSNPVCLEVSVTLRSLPTEAGGLTQPIREELKTVIVFDNGAVLRSMNNLPAGLSLILSNPSARDVVCRVVSGRSMPSVKGYVEVEFMEPVKDFWGIHQESAPPAAPTQSAPASVPRPTLAPPPPSPAPRFVPPRPAPPIPPPVKPAATSIAESPSFDEFPGPRSAPPPPIKPDWKSEPTLPASRASNQGASEYDRSEVASPTSVASWTPAPPEPRAIEKPAFQAQPTTAETSSATNGQTHDFMSKGLMAYEQDTPAPGASVVAGRTPLILGAAALVLAVVCAVVFFMRRGSTPAVSVAKDVATSQSAAPQASSPSSASVPARSTRDDVLPPTTHSEPQLQAKPVASEPMRPESTVAPIPAAVAKTSDIDSDVDSGSTRRLDKSAAAVKQTDTPAAKRPTISNLKIGAPIAPKKGITNLGDGAAPVTEIAAAEMPAEAMPASLLTSSGRTSAPPAPPAGAAALSTPSSAAKQVTDPKLISSARPVYPLAARQANIEGSVTVVAYIDQTGKVFSARALNGPIMLRSAAEQSVKQWKYSPGLEDGKPAQSHMVVKVDFKLN